MTESKKEKHLYFDIETNGLMPKVNKVHCICCIDVNTDEVFQFMPHQLDAATKLLETATHIIGHNIIGYDLPVIKKVLGWTPPEGQKIVDTLVIARLLHSDIKNKDIRNPIFTDQGMGKLVGSHSLKAWGLRLGEHKADYEGGWEEYTQDMMDYMVQDCVTGVCLLRYLKPEEYPTAPLSSSTVLQKSATPSKPQDGQLISEKPETSTRCFAGGEMNSSEASSTSLEAGKKSTGLSSRSAQTQSSDTQASM